jgi:hypothetical protein
VLAGTLAPQRCVCVPPTEVALLPCTNSELAWCAALLVLHDTETWGATM